MIIERMLEYLVLAAIENKITVCDAFTVDGKCVWNEDFGKCKEKLYSMEKIRRRIKELRQEILETYVINTDSKE